MILFSDFGLIVDELLACHFIALFQNSVCIFFLHFSTGITTTKMTVRNRIVKAEKTDSTVISEERTEAAISVEAPEAGHVTEERTPEEEDPVLDLESESPAIIGKDLDHVIVKKDKDLDQEKAGNPIIFGGRDPQGGTGSRGDQDQLNVIETVGNEPRTGELGP